MAENDNQSKDLGTTPLQQDAEDTGEHLTEAESPAPPAAPEEELPEDDFEAAPTDYRRNAWLLIIILGVVVIAWVISILAGPADADEAAAPADGDTTPATAPQQRRPRPQQPPAQARQEPGQNGPSAPRYQQATIKASEDGEFVDAAPERRLPTGQPYRRPRLFNVTRKADAFEPDALGRHGSLENRHANQISVRDLTQVAEENRPRVMRPLSEVPSGLLADDARLVVVTSDETIAAYPVRLMRLRDRLIADRLADRDVLIVWHSEMQTAAALEMSRGSADVPFADAGLLYRGAHVLYDTETRSLWDAYSGTALTGPRAGEQLPRVSADIYAWKALREQHANAQLYLPPGSEDAFNAELQPPRLLSSPEVPFALVNYQPWEQAAHALAPMDIVLGVRSGDAARAYPLGRLYAAGITDFTDEIGGRELSIRVTSPQTGFVAEGDVERQVILWYAWKDRNPDTSVSNRVPTPDETGPSGENEERD